MGTMESEINFPVPKYIEGGCLCGAIRYRVDFPEGFDFKSAVSPPCCVTDFCHPGLSTDISSYTVGQLSMYAV
jgi:hypothetical protein